MHKKFLIASLILVFRVDASVFSTLEERFFDSTAPSTRAFRFQSSENVSCISHKRPNLIFSSWVWLRSDLHESMVSIDTFPFYFGLRLSFQLYPDGDLKGEGTFYSTHESVGQLTLRKYRSATHAYFIFRWDASQSGLDLGDTVYCWWISTNAT